MGVTVSQCVCFVFQNMLVLTQLSHPELERGGDPAPRACAPLRAGALRPRPAARAAGGDGVDGSRYLCAPAHPAKYPLMHLADYATETVHKIKRDGSVSIRGSQTRRIQALATLGLAMAREAHGPGTHPT